MTWAFCTFIGPSLATTDTSVIVKANGVTGTTDCAYRAVSALQPFPVTQATSDQCVQKVHVLHLKKKQDHVLSMHHYSIVDNFTICGRNTNYTAGLIVLKRGMPFQALSTKPLSGLSDTENKLID